MESNEWVTAFNKIFPLITEAPKSQEALSLFESLPENPAYFSGGRFINLMQEFDPSIPHYKEFILTRQHQGLSTTRRTFFYDLLKEQKPATRIRVFEKILLSVESVYPEEASEIRSILLGAQTINQAILKEGFWNSERLNGIIQTIDQAIATKDYERAVTLCYTCVEGIFKGIIKSKIPDEQHLNEITKMAGIIRTYLKGLDVYPDDVCTSVITIAKLINSSRNEFSESHFNEVAARDLAIYIRDITNSVTKLILSRIS
jgi:hypothetical protein